MQSPRVARLRDLDLLVPGQQESFVVGPGVANDMLQAANQLPCRILPQFPPARHSPAERRNWHGNASFIPAFLCAVTSTIFNAGNCLASSCAITDR
jgi:hypothetical protein